MKDEGEGVRYTFTNIGNVIDCVFPSLPSSPHHKIGLFIMHQGRLCTYRQRQYTWKRLITSKIFWRRLSVYPTGQRWRPFHKTFPKSSAFENRFSVRFYETEWSWENRFQGTRGTYGNTTLRTGYIWGQGQGLSPLYLPYLSTLS